MSEREKRFSRRAFLKKAVAGAGLIAFCLGLPPEAAAFPSFPEEAGNYLKPPRPSELLVSQLKLVLPEKPEDLTSLKEWEITRIVQEAAGITVKFELEGKRLNEYHGLIGADAGAGFI